MYVMKNMTAELNAVPLGIFDDLFVQLWRDIKSVLPSREVTVKGNRFSHFHFLYICCCSISNGTDHA